MGRPKKSMVKRRASCLVKVLSGLNLSPKLLVITLISRAFLIYGENQLCSGISLYPVKKLKLLAGLKP